MKRKEEKKRTKKREKNTIKHESDLFLATRIIQKNLGLMQSRKMVKGLQLTADSKFEIKISPNLSI